MTNTYYPFNRTITHKVCDSCGAELEIRVRIDGAPSSVPPVAYGTIIQHLENLSAKLQRQFATSSEHQLHHRPPSQGTA